MEDVVAIHRTDEPFASWSQNLAIALLSSIPGECFVDLCAEHAADDDAETRGDLQDPTAWLVQQSQHDGLLQEAMLRTWRKANIEVVEAAEFFSIDGSAEQCDGLLRQFGAEAVLLELVTGELLDLPEDERGHGGDLTAWTVENVESELVCRELTALLDHWLTDNDADDTPGFAQGRKVRVTIFGGHVRDERKMTERLFAGTAFEVRWKPFEKQAAAPDTKDISEAMTLADAVLLVTSMVSHNIMRVAKRIARKNGIPFCTIPKATDFHLTEALGKLFPAHRHD